jgi:hypothetical protein
MRYHFEPNRIIVHISVGAITLNVRWLRWLLARYDEVAEKMRQQESERRGV